MGEKQTYPKRYKGYLFLKAYSFIFVLLFMLCSFTIDPENGSDTIFTGIMGINSSITFIIAVLCVMVIYAIIILVYVLLYYKTISLLFIEKDITFKHGLIFKTQIIVNYDKMHSVSISRGILLQIFGLSRLSIDSGCTTTSQSDEIVIYGFKQEIEKLEKQINKKIDNIKNNQSQLVEEVTNTDVTNSNNLIEEKEVLLDYKYSFKKILQKIFFSIGLPFSLLFIIVLIILFIVLDSIEDRYVLLLLCIVPIFGFIITVLVNVFKYFDFKIILEEKRVIMKYGLLTKYKHVINKERIKGITISEDLVARVIHGCQVNIELVGLGNISDDNDNNTDNNILIPFCKREEVNDFITKIDEKYIVSNNTYHSPKGSFVSYLSIPFVIISLIFFTLLVSLLIPSFMGIISFKYMFIPIIIYVIFIGITCLLLLLKKSNQGIYFDNNKICFTNGILIRKTFIVLWDNVISLGYFTTPKRAKKGFVSIYIDYYNSSYKNRELVSLIEENVYTELSKILHRLK